MIDIDSSTQLTKSNESFEEGYDACDAGSDARSSLIKSSSMCDGTEQGGIPHGDTLCDASDGVSETTKALCDQAVASLAVLPSGAGAGEGHCQPVATARSHAQRSAHGQSDPIVADRVKRELRRKKSARPAGKPTRNEHKDREKRKLAANTKREASGFSGW